MLKNGSRLNFHFRPAGAVECIADADSVSLPEQLQFLDHRHAATSIGPSRSVVQLKLAQEIPAGRMERLAELIDRQLV